MAIIAVAGLLVVNFEPEGGKGGGAVGMCQASWSVGVHEEVL
jgi:hypothetical protein